MPITVGVLTVSDKCAAGEREDTSAAAVVGWAGECGHEILAREVVPDESDLIASALVRWSDEKAVDLIVTIGGTGLAPRDVTPEATLAVVDRLVPGIPEALRASGRESTARSMLSRAVAGTRGRTLIVNLPGSPKAVRESLEFLKGILPHAVAMMRGEGHPDTEAG